MDTVKVNIYFIFAAIAVVALLVMCLGLQLSYQYDTIRIKNYQICALKHMTLDYLNGSAVCLDSNDGVHIITEEIN